MYCTRQIQWQISSSKWCWCIDVAIVLYKIIVCLSVIFWWSQKCDLQLSSFVLDPHSQLQACPSPHPLHTHTHTHTHTCTRQCNQRVVTCFGGDTCLQFDKPWRRTSLMHILNRFWKWIVSWRGRNEQVQHLFACCDHKYPNFIIKMSSRQNSHENVQAYTFLSQPHNLDVLDLEMGREW